MSYTPEPGYTYHTQDDDGLVFMLQYMLNKLKPYLVDTNTTYTISQDTTNLWFVLTGSDGSTSHVSYADLGTVDGAQIDNTDLTVTNKKIQIPNAGANTRGVVSNADINTLIATALEGYDSIAYLKISSSSALPVAYDSTATYAVGALCTHGGNVYSCNTAISVAEAWNADHWTLVHKLNGLIFLVPSGGTAPNIYDEYAWMPIDTTTTPVTYGYEKIGTTAVDLSGYVQYSDIHILTNSEIAEIVDDAFDAVWPPSNP